MNVNTDAFARLQKLHAQGMLTDAEYEQEKAKLRSPPIEAAPSFRQPWEVGREAGRGFRAAMRPWTIMTAVLVLLIGAYFLGRGALLAEKRGELRSSASSLAGQSTEQVVAADSPWTIETKTDPMTDATLRQATAKIEGSQFNVEVAMTCTTTGDIHFTATAFDKSDKPVELRSEVGNNLDTSIPFQLRLDNAKAQSLWAHNPKFSNQIEYNSSDRAIDQTGSWFHVTEGIAAASRIVMRLSAVTGDDTFQWGQSDPAFRDMVAPCLSIMKAQAQKVARDEAAAAQRRESEAARLPVGPVNAM